MVRIQVKKYQKRYLTWRKGNYTCTSYYLYVPERFAKPLIDKELRFSLSDKGLIIEVVRNLDSPVQAS